MIHPLYPWNTTSLHTKGKNGLKIFLSVRPSACNNWRTAERIFTKFDIWKLLSKIYRHFRFWLKSDKNNGHFTRRRTWIFDSWSGWWGIPSPYMCFWSLKWLGGESPAGKFPLHQSQRSNSGEPRQHYNAMRIFPNFLYFPILSVRITFTPVETCLSLQLYPFDLNRKSSLNVF
jgi:hypothetical protein